MPLTITKLKMWEDPGYTRRCVEVPPVGSKKLPAPDYTLPLGETLRPDRGSTLTSLKLPLSYTQLFSMSYLYIEASDGIGTVKLFGWVDSIEMIASSESNIKVSWSVDWWRSFSNDITFGAGTVTRCTTEGYKRPYAITPRYKLIDTVTELTPFTAGDHTVWVIAIGAQSSPGNNSQLKYYYSPIGTFFKTSPTGTAYTGVTEPEIMKVLLDIMNNQSPRVSIMAVYLSTMSPVPMNYDSNTYTWTVDQLYTGGIISVLTDAGGYNACMQFDPWTTSNYQTITLTNSLSGLSSDDNTDYIVTDFNGNIMATLPYGIGFKSAMVRLSLGVNSSYLDVNFTNYASGYSDYSTTDGASKTFLNALTGFRVSIPLPRLTLTEDQYSEYIVSGQRDFDMENMRIQREQTAVKGLTGIGTSAVGGAITGAMVGSAPGAVIGGVAGSAGSLIGTGINYLMDEVYSDRLQNARDKLYANQRNGVILSGDNNDFLLTVVAMDAKSGPALVKMVSDATSALEYEHDIELNGYECNYNTSDTTTFLTSPVGGPLQIINLVLTGDAPPQAKQAIKIMLENGIRIVEHNTGGIVP